MGVLFLYTQHKEMSTHLNTNEIVYQTAYYALNSMSQ